MRKWRKTGNKKFLTLDKWFSAYIRLRDTNEFGQARCITCQKKTEFDDLDAGHFKTRNIISTRFYERNVHAQCQSCNRFSGGEQIAHSIRIAQRYGQSELDKIEAKSRSTMKLLPFEVKEMQQKYKLLARELFIGKTDKFKEDHKNLIK